MAGGGLEHRNTTQRPVRRGSACTGCSEVARAVSGAGGGGGSGHGLVHLRATRCATDNRSRRHLPPRTHTCRYPLTDINDLAKNYSLLGSFAEQYVVITCNFSAFYWANIMEMFKVSGRSFHHIEAVRRKIIF